MSRHKALLSVLILSLFACSKERSFAGEPLPPMLKAARLVWTGSQDLGNGIKELETYVIEQRFDQVLPKLEASINKDAVWKTTKVNQLALMTRSIDGKRYAISIASGATGSDNKLIVGTEQRFTTIMLATPQ